MSPITSNDFTFNHVVRVMGKQWHCKTDSAHRGKSEIQTQKYEMPSKSLSIQPSDYIHLHCYYKSMHTSDWWQQIVWAATVNFFWKWPQKTFNWRNVRITSHNKVTIDQIILSEQQSLPNIPVTKHTRVCCLLTVVKLKKILSEDYYVSNGKAFSISPVCSSRPGQLGLRYRKWSSHISWSNEWNINAVSL